MFYPVIYTDFQHTYSNIAIAVSAPRSNNLSGNFLAFAIGIFVSIIVLELALRILNPSNFILKGDNIVLRPAISEVIVNTEISRLDTLIYHSTNSLGFRGPEKPADFEKYLTIFAVGGSTTECRFLSDGKDWPALLANKLNKNFDSIWINNSGLDGHSTFGHLMLLQEHILRHHPKFILILAGRNDVLRDDLNWDSKQNENFYRKAVNLFSHSEIFSLALNLYRVHKAKQRNLRHFNLDLELSEKLFIPDSIINRQVQAHEREFMVSYRNRLQQIIDACRSKGAEPVFITQPTLVGDGVDSLTQVNLATIKTGDSENGKLLWTLLESYNRAVKVVCSQNHCPAIDLALKMPKNSKYFYDYIHFTNDGAEVVAEVIFKDLSPWLDTAVVRENLLSE